MSFYLPGLLQSILEHPDVLLPRQLFSELLSGTST